MIRAAVIALAVASPASAAPFQSIGSGPARVEIAQTQRGYVVTFRNTLVKSLTVEAWAVDLEGIAVSGVISAGNGDIPDDLIVTPPTGWWCEPSCTVTVPENDVGTVTLWPEVAA